MRERKEKEKRRREGREKCERGTKDFATFRSFQPINIQDKIDFISRIFVLGGFLLFLFREFSHFLSFFFLFFPFLSFSFLFFPFLSFCIPFYSHILNLCTFIMSISSSGRPRLLFLSSKGQQGVGVGNATEESIVKTITEIGFEVKVCACVQCICVKNGEGMTLFSIFFFYNDLSLPPPISHNSLLLLSPFTRKKTPRTSSPARRRSPSLSLSAGPPTKTSLASA